MKLRHTIVSFAAVLYACGSPDSGLSLLDSPPDSEGTTPPAGFSWVDPHVSKFAVPATEADADVFDADQATDSGDVTDSEVVSDTDVSDAFMSSDAGETFDSDMSLQDSSMTTDDASAEASVDVDASDDAGDSVTDAGGYPDHKCKWVEHGKGHHYGHYKQCLKGNVDHKVWCCVKPQ